MKTEPIHCPNCGALAGIGQPAVALSGVADPAAYVAALETALRAITAREPMPSGGTQPMLDRRQCTVLAEQVLAQRQQH